MYVVQAYEKVKTSQPVICYSLPFDHQNISVKNVNGSSNYTRIIFGTPYDFRVNKLNSRLVK